MKLLWPLDGDFIQPQTQPFKTCPDRLHHKMAGLCQRDLAVAAQKELLTDFIFKPSNLFANRRLRDQQLITSLGKAFVPCGAFKNAECVE